MEHPAIANVSQTCWACPEQYEGQLADGRFFYFRYRWGCATLGVGATPDDAVSDPNEVGVTVGDRLCGSFESTEERDHTFSRLLLDRRWHDLEWQ